jgi:Putative DNA-binding domain
MTRALAEEQSTLLDVLAGRANSTFKLRGLQVYQANRAVLAERTLASTYPVICQLIGETSFEPLARHFWQQHPPLQGDMGQWGALLPVFLDAAPQLADEPFLGDVARIEWALHRAASAPNAVLDAASFALLSAPDDAQPVSLAITLALSPGAFTLASAYPVASIVNAHLPNVTSSPSQPTLDEAADLLRQGQGEYALVWRQGFKPRVRILPAAEYNLIHALQQGKMLDLALDAALATDPSFDFNTWLGQAVQTALVVGAICLPPIITANHP